MQHDGLQPARLFCPWNSPGKNTGAGFLALSRGPWHRDWTCISYIYPYWQVGFVLFCLPPVPPKKPTLPGGPVVKNPSCKCRAHGLNLWSGNYNPTCLRAATTEPVCRNYLSPRSTTREYMHRSERSQVMQQRSTKTWHENKYFF